MDFVLLERLFLFRSVQADELEQIFTGLKITETYFEKGDILAMQDEPANRLIILLKGSVRGEMTDPAGKVVKVEDIYAPNPLAILFLFGENNRFPVQATANEDVTAIIISRQSVLRMLSMNETILKNYLDISADFASRLSRKLHFMSFRTIRQKVAMYLLELASKNGVSVGTQSSAIVLLDRTKAALAEYFGVSRQSLEREMSNMQDDALIISGRKEITILDLKALANLINR